MFNEWLENENFYPGGSVIDWCAEMEIFGTTDGNEIRSRMQMYAVSENYAPPVHIVLPIVFGVMVVLLLFLIFYKKPLTWLREEKQKDVFATYNKVVREREESPVSTSIESAVTNGVLAAVYDGARKEESRLAGEQVVVRPAKGYLIIGIVCTALFGALLFLSLLLVEEKGTIIFVYVIFVAALLLSFYILSQALRLRVRVVEHTTYKPVSCEATTREALEYTPAWGKSRIILFEEITKVELLRPGGVSFRHAYPWLDVYVNGRRVFSVEKGYVDCNALLGKLREKEVPIRNYW